MSEAPTTILLIRHGHTAVVGQRLVGHLPGVRLSEHGAAQARRLAGRLAADPIAAVYSSPLERATHTAAPLARQRALDVRLDSDLIEVDFGAWTGRTFAELEADERWQRFNTRRASAEVPGGERRTRCSRESSAPSSGLRPCTAGRHSWRSATPT